jgi:hypothetical protein
VIQLRSVGSFGALFNSSEIESRKVKKKVKMKFERILTALIAGFVCALSSGVKGSGI